MKKFNIKTIIIAAILALALIGATVFVCVTVLNGDNTGEVGGDNNASENPGHIDDGGWTWD